jgi:hypothetical protein
MRLGSQHLRIGSQHMSLPGHGFVRWLAIPSTLMPTSYTLNPESETLYWRQIEPETARVHVVYMLSCTGGVHALSTRWHLLSQQDGDT